MARSAEVISHWYHLVDGLSASARDFYDAVEAKLQAQAIPYVETAHVEWQEGGLGSPHRLYLRVRRDRLVFDICAAPFGKGYFVSWWLVHTPDPLGRFLLFLLLAVSASSGYWGSHVTWNHLPREMVQSISDYRSLVGPVLGVAGAIIAPLLGLLAIRILSGEEMVESIPVIGWLYQKVFDSVTYFRLDTALMFQESVRRVVLAALGDLVSQQGLKALTVEEGQPRLRDLGKR